MEEYFEKGRYKLLLTAMFKSLSRESMRVGEIWGKQSISHFPLLLLQNFRKRLPRSTLSMLGAFRYLYLHNGVFYSFFSGKYTSAGWEQQITLLLPISQAVSQFRDIPSIFPEVFRGHRAELLRSWQTPSVRGRVELCGKRLLSFMQQNGQCGPIITCIYCTAWKRLLCKACCLLSFVSSQLPNADFFWPFPLITSSHSVCLLSTLRDGDTHSIEPCWSLKFPSMRQINSLFFAFFFFFFV